MQCRAPIEGARYIFKLIICRMSRIIIGLEHQNQNYSGIVANLKVYLENLQAIDNASFQKELMEHLISRSKYKTTKPKKKNQIETQN